MSCEDPNCECKNTDQTESSEPTSLQLIEQELRSRIQVYQTKAQVFQSMLDELPKQTLSEDALTALLHLLATTRRNV